MPGFAEELAVGGAAARMPTEYSVLKQRVDLDIDFAQQSLRGSTEITLQPLIKDLKQIRLHCRQCKPTSIQAGGITAKFEYGDPYRRLRMPRGATVHQHKMLKDKVELSLRPNPEPELTIALPSKLKIQELHVDAATAIPQSNGMPSLQQQESDAIADVAEAPTMQAAAQQAPQFAPIKLFIEFEVTTFQDGLRWIGCEQHDKRYPYLYTRNEPWAGNTSCIFPCVDDATSRCSWDLSIRSPRTLGDAFKKPSTAAPAQELASNGGDTAMVNGVDGAHQPAVITTTEPVYLIDLSEEDAALEMVVVCIGEQMDVVIDTEDESRHTVSFSLSDPVIARHVGFAIGPFERVDLSSSRDADDEEKLGQSAVKVDGYCLPGRGEEVRNTCFPVTRIIDHFGVNYGSFPFPSYQVLFVDDLAHDTAAAAGLSMFNSHLLFPKEIIEPLERNTRIIIRAVADQWMGVSVVAKEPSDAWAIAGIAGYMSDTYGKILFGNNAYRWQQKLAAERVYELDADRPSIHQHGSLLHLDPSVRDFLDLKAALILFILDRRLLKASGSSGVQRIVNRLFLISKTGALENGELSTAEFQRQCERLSHAKLEPFFRQWVFGAGCPIFEVSQRFNKKKLVVEMTLVQRQMDRKTKPPFAPNNFMREIKEHVADVWAPEIQPVFTGPMTIRIHEADGTPYEHIVEVKEQITKLEIPYNTKYKRLKRSRRQKDRGMNENNTGEGDEGSLLYCLGDILDSEEDKQEWQLVDWGKEAEEQMGQESYEWIRMDADFEWIGKIHLTMPTYMYVSQLQQDRDLVAQYESMKWLILANPHHVSLSILVRTLMDRRYFYGIRTMAAEGLGILAANARAEQEGGENLKNLGRYHLEKAFEDLFCFPGETMPKPNDWSDRTNFLLQCAIPRALARLRDREGKVPMGARQFFLDKLRFNDNSDNPFSDCHYVATLMSCLADAMVISHREPQPTYTFSFGEDELMEPENPDEPFETEGINAIERYRRIDEWETTYHNIYSLTALECLQKLKKAGMVKDKTKEVLQYTRPSNADLVRIAAFRCLTEAGVTRKASMMRYLLHSIADEPSPFVRSKLLAIFGEALGHLALGDEAPQEPAALPLAAEGADGLVLEQEASNEARQLEALRKTTPEGAIAALKAALGNDEIFKQALWYAATAPDITLDEIAAFCDVAALLYPAVASSRVILKLPRTYNKCEHMGKGKMRFLQHGPYRLAPRKPLELEDLQQMRSLGLSYSGPVPEEAVKRRQSSEDEVSLKQIRAQTLQQPQVMGPPAPHTAPTPTTEKPTIKLKLGDKRKAGVDLGSQRAGSPKAQKLLSHAGSPPPAAKRSPSVVSQRRGSTPGPSALGRPVKRGPVKLQFSDAGQARLREIISRVPQPGGMRALPPAPQQETNRSITPTSSLIQQPTSPANFFGAQSSLLQSPSGTSFFSASPGPAQPQLNLGGFRSYGPPPEVPAVIAEIKHETIETSRSPSIAPVNGNAPSMSPPASISSMPPPPKKKVTLKLVARKPSVDTATGGAGSPK